MAASEVVAAGAVASIDPITTSIDIDGKAHAISARRVRLNVELVWKGDPGSNRIRQVNPR
jgi:hypothetical protein